MGNCSCTSPTPEVGTSATATESPLIDSKTSSKKSNSKGKSQRKKSGEKHKLIVAFDKPYLKLYRGIISSEKSHHVHGKYVTNIVQISTFDSDSMVDDYNKEIRQAIIKNDSSFDNSTKFALFDSQTKCSTISDIKCDDIQIESKHGNEAKFIRYLIAEKAIKINFKIIKNNGAWESKASNDDDDDKEEDVITTTAVVAATGGAGGGRGSTSQMKMKKNKNDISKLDSPICWMYENENLQEALCKYCDFFNTVPSRIEFYRKNSKNVLQAIDSFDTIENNNVENGDTLMIHLKQKWKKSSKRKIDSANEHENMKIYVKTLASTKRIELVNIDKNYVGLDCKYLIWKSNGIEINQQRLIFTGTELKDQDKLDDLGISNESVLHLIIK